MSKFDIVVVDVRIKFIKFYFHLNFFKVFLYIKKKNKYDSK